MPHAARPPCRPGRRTSAGLACGLAAALLAFSATVQAEDEASAKAFDAAGLVREVESAVGLAQGLRLQAGKSLLREGEPLVLTIDLPHSGYLNVISIDPAGAPTVLFPNRFQPGNSVAQGTFTLPTAQMAFELKTSAPFGESRIAAFLTSEPLNLYATGDGERNAAGALLARFARLSTAGRDLINLVTSGNLQQDAKAGRILAGMTTVLSCAKTGPCAAASAVPAGIRRIVDAVVPGIFLDKDFEVPQAKSQALRPVYRRGIALTKASEGFVPHLYLDAAGYCTIAYGHLLRLDGCIESDSARYRGGISEPDGVDLLMGDLARAQRAVMAFVDVALTDGQYASLVDFTYNVGAANLRHSTLLKAVNAKQFERVPFQLLRWTRAGGKEYRGLRTRREREIALFFEGVATPKALPAGEDVSPIDIRIGEPER